MPILTWFGGFYTYGIISYVSTTWPGFISQYFPSWKTLPLFQPYLICLLFVQLSPSPQGWSLISWAPWVFVHTSYHVAYHDMTCMCGGHVQLFATPQTVARRSSLSRDFPGENTGGVAISSSRGSSWPRDRILVSCIAGRFFTIWVTREGCHKIST